MNTRRNSIENNIIQWNIRGYVNNYNKFIFNTYI